MKRSLAATLAICGGGVLGYAARHRWTRRQSPEQMALSRMTAYFIVPVWIGAGFLDYIWHRQTKIETTSGIEESLMHSLMMVEAAPAVLAPLFVEINAGVLAGMIGLATLHELTVLWDLWFTTPRRAIPGRASRSPTRSSNLRLLWWPRPPLPHIGNSFRLCWDGGGTPALQSPPAKAPAAGFHARGDVCRARVARRAPAFRRVAPLLRSQAGGANRSGYSGVSSGSLFLNLRGWRLY